jgi:transcriptional regulator with XRE-family HTH domain
MTKKHSHIGKWLKEKRLKADYDTHTLANQAGIGQSQVSRIETGTSGLTLNALISLARVLGITPDELASETATPRVIDRRPEVRDVSNLSDKLFIYDLEAFFYKYFLQQDESLFSFLSIYFHEAYISASKNREVSFDDVQKQVRHAIILGQKIPNPKNISQELLWDYYLENGVVSLDDAAAYLALSRKEARLTLEELSGRTGIAQSIINRIEQGQTERLGLDEIANLDTALNADGKIFSMFWHGLEFQMGISRNRFYIYGSGMSPFAWSSYPLADVFVKLARWAELYSSLKWLIDFRESQPYEPLSERIPIDYLYNYDLPSLSRKAFEYLRLSLPHLVHGKDAGADTLGGKFVIDPAVINLWNRIEKQMLKHPLGLTTLSLLRDHISNEDYHGMFRAVLQETLRQNEDFRTQLMDNLNLLIDNVEAPTWVPGKWKIED